MEERVERGSSEQELAQAEIARVGTNIDAAITSVMRPLVDKVHMAERNTVFDIEDSFRDLIMRTSNITAQMVEIAVVSAFEKGMNKKTPQEFSTYVCDLLRVELEHHRPKPHPSTETKA